MTIAEVNKAISDEGGRPWNLRMWARRFDPESVERIEKEWDTPENVEFCEAMKVIDGINPDDIDGVGAYTKGCESIIINHWLNKYSRAEIVALLNGFAKEPELATNMKVVIFPDIDPLSLSMIAYRWNDLHKDEKEIEVNFPPAIMI